MSQTDVLEYLESNPNQWFTAKDISEKLNITKKNAGINLKKLLKRKDVPLEMKEGRLKDHLNYHRTGYFWRYAGVDE